MNLPTKIAAPLAPAPSLAQMFARPFAALIRAVRVWHQRRIDRAAFHRLLQLDDNMLKDIGVTRYDVVRAANLPLTHNAAHELQKVARNGHAA